MLLWALDDNAIFVVKSFWGNGDKMDINDLVQSMQHSYCVLVP
jgi:hypothetical protein